MDKSTSTNSSTSTDTSAVFICYCCAVTRESRARIYERPNGTKFLVCRGCYHRLALLASMPTQYRSAMLIIGELGAA